MNCLYFLGISFREGGGVAYNCLIYIYIYLFIYLFILLLQIKFCHCKDIHYNSVSKALLLVDPFWLRKITTDPDILAHVNVECLDDRYPQLKI